MAIVTPVPILMGNATVKIGGTSGNNYEGAVSSVEFQPSAGTVNFKGLAPTAVYTYGTAPTWALALTFAQDFETTTSLSNYLFDNQGKTVQVDVFPVAGTGKKGFSAQVIIQPGSIGGAVDSVAVATVTLGVIGAPTRITQA
jgi:hypothetical protein